jgi:hypothetical protein
MRGFKINKSRPANRYQESPEVDFMAWMDAINEIISKYSGAAGGTAAAPADPHQDFVNVAKAAPQDVTADALAHNFRSDQTPSFPEQVANLFRGSNSNQRAGLLNHLLGAINPATLASIPGLKGLAGTLGGQQTVTPQQADQISPEQVQQAAAHAESSNPSIIDQVSRFYAAHPNVVKALGGAAIATALRRIATRQSSS